VCDLETPIICAPYI